MALAIRLRIGESVLACRAGVEQARVSFTTPDRITVRVLSHCTNGRPIFNESVIEGVIAAIGDCTSYIDFEVAGAKVICSKDRDRETLKVVLDTDDDLLSFVRSTLLNMAGSDPIVNTHDHWVRPSQTRSNEWVEQLVNATVGMTMDTSRMTKSGQVNRGLVLRHMLLQQPYATKIRETL